MSTAVLDRRLHHCTVVNIKEGIYKVGQFKIGVFAQIPTGGSNVYHNYILLSFVISTIIDNAHKVTNIKPRGNYFMEKMIILVS